jgi:hypothetical protein
VSPQNVTIYDAKHGGNMSRSTPFKGLPDGVRVADKWGGFSAKTTVPAPYLDGNAERSCLEHLVNGTVDILINIAMCKGHGGQFGGFTLSMKNHFGTFDPQPGHAEGGGADYVIGINKSPEVLGEMDARTGKVLFPRQQLVLIDALWASGGGGPCARPSDQLNTLVMGTCGPAVDYVVATKVRQERMGWRINPGVADRFLAEFGFSKEDLPQDGRLIDAAASA